MKRKYPQSLGSILKELIEATGLKPELERKSIESVWPEIVGPHIAAYCKDVKVKGSTLHVTVTSASLKEDLSYMRDLLVPKLNEYAHQEIIDSIILH